MRDITRSHDILTNELEHTSRGFTRSLEGISPEGWLHRPAPDCWSVAETAEHVALVENSILKALRTKLAQNPLADTARAGQKARDAFVTTSMFDRSTRRPAPEFVRPTGRYPEPRMAAEAFSTARAALIEWLATTELDLRGLALPHPALGLLDGKQWILFAAAHCERHTRQILEVRQAPGFPGA